MPSKAEYRREASLAKNDIREALAILADINARVQRMVELVLPEDELELGNRRTA